MCVRIGVLVSQVTTTAVEEQVAGPSSHGEPCTKCSQKKGKSGNSALLSFPCVTKHHLCLMPLVLLTPRKSFRDIRVYHSSCWMVTSLPWVVQYHSFSHILKGFFFLKRSYKPLLVTVLQTGTNIYLHVFLW